MNYRYSLVFAVVIICLAATAAVTVSTHRSSQGRAGLVFDTITSDNLTALNQRFSDYQQALRGAAGLINASENVTLEDWRSYVETLQINESLPGLNGIGWIEPVGSGGKSGFLLKARRDGLPDFAIKRDTPGELAFVIKYIEPLEPNIEAQGLNIAFEEGRKSSAQRARDTGEPQLTPRILLVQDQEKLPGFLLLMPVYTTKPTASKVRGAFEGWTYAPFVGYRALYDLTGAQSQYFTLSVFAGDTDDRDTLIYSKESEEDASVTAAFERSQNIQIFGQTWHVVWRSTPAFEAEQTSYAPLMTGFGGLLLTILLGALVNMLLQREDAVRRLVAVQTRKLNANEQQNRSIIENARISIMVLDDEGRVLTANPMTERMFNRTRDSIIGKPVSNVIGIAAQRHEACSRRVTGVAGDGREIRLDQRFSEWSASNGEGRATIMLQDVTDEEHGAERLRVAEARWNQVLESSDIGVFDIDLVNGKSIVSDTWCRLMGMDRNDSRFDPQRDFLNRIHPEDLPLLQEADRACIAGEADHSIATYRVRFANNQWRWMRSDATVAARDAQGRALRLLGAQTDVTELREIRDSLQASELRFRTLSRNAPVGMVLCDGYGIMTGSNQALCKLLDCPEPELIGRHFKEFMVRDDFTKLHRVTDSLRRQHVSGLEGEYRLSSAKGEEIWCLISVAMLVDPITNEDTYIIQIQDIRELKKVDKMKSEFVSTVSHELRTPLTSIKGALSLLNGQFLPDMAAAGTRLMTIAQTNCDRLIELVNDILDMEKIASGQIEFDTEDHDIAALVQQAVEQTEPMAHSHNVVLRTHFCTPSPTGHVDARRFIQVCANLISNAAKYSFDDTTVDIHVQRRDGKYRVRVANKGPGIPENFRSKLFQPFQQADSSDTRSRGGTGLGLNIAREIVERMNGTISFKSVENEETSFWMTLDEVGARASSGAVVALPDHTRSGHGIPKILHLEDDADFSEILKNSFGGLADIISVDTLAKARPIVTEQTFDLIIIDWDLPDGNGTDLIDTITQSQPQTPIIGLSAFESGVRNKRIVHDIVKSRSELSEVVNKVLKVLSKPACPESSSRTGS